MIQNDDKKVMLMANRVFTVMEKRVSAEDAVRIPILFGLYSLLKIRNFKFRLVPSWETVVKYIVVVSIPEQPLAYDWSEFESKYQ